MKPRTLAINTSVQTLVEEILHTRARLRAYPFLSTQAGEFEPLFTGCQTLTAQEMALLQERLEAEARVIAVDDKLDLLCAAIAAAVLVECGNDRKAPLYQRYFGGARPSKLRRPVLGQQLDTMRTWPPSLQEPDQPEVLRGYGAQLEALVVEADAATTALSEAQRKLADHEIGTRKDFVDSLNASRIDLYGGLSALTLEQPELKLGRDFAHGFFKRGRGRRALTMTDVEHMLVRLREQLDKYQILRDRMLAAQEAARQEAEDAELRAAEEALLAAEAAQAEAEQAALEAAARVQELRDQLSGEEQAEG